MIYARRIVFLSLIVTAAALSFDGRAQGGGQIDLSGDWTVTVEGDVTLTCTVTAQETGTDVQAQLNCPGIGETPLAGSVDPQTRGVFLRLGAEKGLDVELHGTVSDDANAVDGSWGWSANRLTGTFHAVRGITSPPVPDLNGTWTVDVGSAASGLCSASVQQNGASIELDLACPGQPTATIKGAIEKQMLTLSGGPFQKVQAAIAANGESVGGTWYGMSCCQSGPFTGLKNMGSTFNGDVTGDWQISVTGGLIDCRVAVQESVDNALFAAFDCGRAGGWWLRGAIDSETGSFALQGMAGSKRDWQASIRGVMSEDRLSFTGTFAANAGHSWIGGTLTGNQVDDSPSFMDVNGQYDVQLISQFGETVTCSVALEQTQETLMAPTHCVGVGDGTVQGWLSPLTGVLEIEGTIGNVEMTFDGTAQANGSAFDLSGTWTTDRRFVEGCFTTSESCQQANRGVPGDADCDGRTDSIDAVLILQVSAGLLPIGSVPCPGNVSRLRFQCCPVVFNALDAAIILQLDAGLFGRLTG